MTIVTPAAIHQFWFGTLNSAGLADAEHRQRWFSIDAEFDQQIAREFGATFAAARQGALQDWWDASAGWLSYLLLCDQFPRNIFRGSADAFAGDALALAAARVGLERGHHHALTLDEQAFAYLPFEHSEDPLDQYLSVGLLTTLRDHAQPELRSQAGDYLRHAQQHRDLILRFGRFPHRNAVLQRHNSAAETAYLAQASGGFGQSPA